MRRWLAASMAVAATLLGAQARGGVTAGWVVLGLEDVSLGAGVRVEAGDVVANVGTARLGPRAQVAGAVAADVIRLGRGADAGSLFCRLLVGGESFPCAPLSLPVVDASQLGLVQVLPGAAEVRVPRRARATPLSAGAWGRVAVGARGRLVLAGGDYAVRSIVLAPHASLLCAAPCRIGVQEGVRVGGRAVLGAAAPLEAGAVTVEIEGRAGGGFRAHPHARVSALVYAPESRVTLGQMGVFQGTFVGRVVDVGPRARITTPGGS